MKKKIVINGHTFEVHRSKYAKVENLARYAGRTLYDCYSVPSSSKISIYHDWLDWACTSGVQYFGVSSYNTFGFSLQGLIKYDGTIYMLSITPNTNKAFIIE